MFSVSSIVRGIVNENKLFQEGMRQGILSYGAVAERLKKRVENEAGSSVKESAIVMALRRHSEKSEKKERKENRKSLELESEIILKTGLFYISFAKVPHALDKLQKFHSKLRQEKDTFNLIQGNYEVSIITNSRHAAKLRESMGKENVRIEENNLVSVSITVGKDFAYTPGIIFSVTRKLYWEDINIFEILTTATELTFLFQQKYAIKAYNSISELVQGKIK